MNASTKKKQIENKIKTNPLDDDGDEEDEALLAPSLVAPRIEKVFRSFLL